MRQSQVSLIASEELEGTVLVRREPQHHGRFTDRTPTPSFTAYNPLYTRLKGMSISGGGSGARPAGIIAGRLDSIAIQY